MAPDGWDDDEDEDEFHDPHLLALRALAELRRVLDRFEASLVDEARRGGWSWTEIGAELGLTKAGVYRRHSGHDPVAARRRARRAAADRPASQRP